MNLHNYKKIGIIGFAREGRSLLNYLEKIDFQGEVFIMDRDISLQYPETFLNVSLLLGQTYLDSLEHMDLIFKSAGVPLRLPEIQNAIKFGVEVTSIVNLFFSLNTKPVIAVSGTKGKSSTVTFIKDVLDKAGYKNQLVGNIGNPILDYLEMDVDFFIFEMSSYMLETFQGKIEYGIFTSFFPDHMDTHGSFENYQKAKFKFFEVCTHLYVNDGNPIVKEFLNTHKIVYRSFDDSKVRFVNTNLYVLDQAFELKTNLGNEILNNFKGAILCLMELGIRIEEIVAGIKNFKKLPHRQEIYLASNGLRIIDDSASITPESTIAAIENFQEDLKVLILGGQNRGYDFTELNNLILKLKIPYVLVLPDLNDLDFPFLYSSFENLPELVGFIAKLNLQKGIILFSPGSPSYNCYKNFAERGQDFLKSLQEFKIIN